MQLALLLSLLPPTTGAVTASSSRVDSDASTSESEDEEGDLLTPKLDVQILKTLQALKRGDDSVYDKNVAFFDGKGGADDDDAGDDKEEEGGGDVKHKPKRYKDVVREQLLEQIDDEDNEGNKTDQRATTSNEEGHDLAYDQEQKDLRRAFLDDGSDEDEDNEWTKPTAKKNDSAESSGG